jgi:hypothetical protein
VTVRKASKAMKEWGPDSNKPRLCIWEPGPKPLPRRQLVLVDFIDARFNVNGNELPIVSRRQVGPNSSFVDLVAAAGELVFRVTALN